MSLETVAHKAGEALLGLVDSSAPVVKTDSVHSWWVATIIKYALQYSSE